MVKKVVNVTVCPRESEVLISGKIACGKTTVLRIIKEALESRGFEVEIDDIDWGLHEEDRDPEFVLTREHAVATTRKIKLTSRQIRRQPWVRGSI